LIQVRAKTIYIQKQAGPKAAQEVDKFEHMQTEYLALKIYRELTRTLTIWHRGTESPYSTSHRQAIETAPQYQKAD